jgi:hypothetical protein
MRKISNTLAVSLVAGLSLSVSAEMHLEWHWEDSGGGGSCGRFCTGVTPYVLVIDGWTDDATGDGNRFPRSGKIGLGGGGGSKVSFPKTPGKGCTLANKIPGVLGMPAGFKQWNFYIDPSTTKIMQDAFRQNFELINADQAARGRNFRIVETSIEQAYSFISPPGATAPPLRPADLATTYAQKNRDGSLRTTWTTVSLAPIDSALALTLAAHEIGHAFGADEDLGSTLGPKPMPDDDYPTVMYATPPKIAGLTMDPCTLAIIDASANRGR